MEIINQNQNEQAKAIALEQVLIQGDLSKLSPEQRVTYYNKVCDSLELNPLTKPFEYITLNGKLTLYARRDCTDQLRKRDQISVTISSRELIGDIYVVTAKAKTPDCREDESTGCVPIMGLKGDMLANAYMKAETKAKRRVTLSICGLGMLDESETPSEGAAFQPQSPVKRVASWQIEKMGLLKTRREALFLSPEKILEICKEQFKKESPKDLSEEEMDILLDDLNAKLAEQAETD